AKAVRDAAAIPASLYVSGQRLALSAQNSADGRTLIELARSFPEGCVFGNIAACGLAFTSFSVRAKPQRQHTSSTSRRPAMSRASFLLPIVILFVVTTPVFGQRRDDIRYRSGNIQVRRLMDRVGSQKEPKQLAYFTIYRDHVDFGHC